MNFFYHAFVPTNRQYFDRGVDVEELSKELELQIQGAEKPTVWRLLGIRFILLPYTIGKVMFLMYMDSEFNVLFSGFTVCDNLVCYTIEYNFEPWYIE